MSRFTEEWYAKRQRLAAVPSGVPTPNMEIVGEIVNTEQWPKAAATSPRHSQGTVSRPPPRRVALVLPMPPSLNHSLRHVPGAHYVTTENKNFRAMVAHIFRQSKMPALSGRLRVCIVLFPADKRRWDIDNRIKNTLDALQLAGVFADDEQVDQLEITRIRDTKRGECGVTVLEL